MGSQNEPTPIISESTKQDGYTAEPTGQEGSFAESTGQDGHTAASTGQDGQTTEPTGRDGSSTGGCITAAESTGQDGTSVEENLGIDEKNADTTGQASLLLNEDNVTETEKVDVEQVQVTEEAEESSTEVLSQT